MITRTRHRPFGRWDHAMRARYVASLLETLDVARADFEVATRALELITVVGTRVP